MPAVLTGLGAVGSFGSGIPALREVLRAARLHVSEVDRSAGYHLPESARTAARQRARLASSGFVIADTSRAAVSSSKRVVRPQRASSSSSDRRPQ